MTAQAWSGLIDTTCQLIEARALVWELEAACSCTHVWALSVLTDRTMIRLDRLISLIAGFLPFGLPLAALSSSGAHCKSRLQHNSGRAVVAMNWNKPACTHGVMPAAKPASALQTPSLRI